MKKIRLVVHLSDQRCIVIQTKLFWNALGINEGHLVQWHLPAVWNSCNQFCFLTCMINYASSRIPEWSDKKAFNQGGWILFPTNMSLKSFTHAFDYQLWSLCICWSSRAIRNECTMSSAALKRCEGKSRSTSSDSAIQGVNHSPWDKYDLLSNQVNSDMCNHSVICSLRNSSQLQQLLTRGEGF